MPTTMQDIQKVREKASAKSAESTQYKAAGTSLEGNVMQAVHEARQERGVSQLATDVGNTMGQLATDPAGVRERASNIVNPIDVDQMTAGVRGQNLRTLGTAAAQAEYNYGTLKDIISAGANQLVARGQIAAAKAQELVAEADNMFQKLQFEESVRQFNEELAEKQRQFNTTQASKGSGSGKSSPEKEQEKYAELYANYAELKLANPDWSEDQLINSLVLTTGLDEGLVRGALGMAPKVQRSTSGFSSGFSSGSSGGASNSASLLDKIRDMFRGSSSW